MTPEDHNRLKADHDKAYELLHRVILELSAYIAEKEGNLLYQMCVANADELAAYRATNLAPDEVKCLQRRYEQALRELDVERDRDTALEAQRYERKTQALLELLDRVRDVAEEVDEI